MTRARGDRAGRVAIVLAAGLGERMGGSKALLLLEGEPLARAHATRFVEAGCARVLVVTRPEVAVRLAPMPELTVLARATASQAESLREAVLALGSIDGFVFVTPVDAPPVSAVTLRALLKALDAGALLATPVHRGRGGHPVACRAPFLAPYARSAEGSAPILRDLLRACAGERVRVDVDDSRVGLDLDTPQDVIALSGGLPRFA